MEKKTVAEKCREAVASHKQVKRSVWSVLYPSPLAGGHFIDKPPQLGTA